MFSPLDCKHSEGSGMALFIAIVSLASRTAVGTE